jgi:hypothetical protein
MAGGLLSLTPMAFGQTSAAPAPPPKMTPQTAPAPMPKPSAQAPMATRRPGQRIVIVEPIRVFDPFFDYPYPYAYPPDYMARNFGYVKLDTKDKDASVYVDGGFADKVSKAKKFALRPGNHDIELRDSDNRTIFKV